MKDRQTINEIMKSHKPWTVGVCTDRSDNAIFYPVIYKASERKWYGYTDQFVHSIAEKVGSCRSGVTKRWSVARTGKKRLSEDHLVMKWLHNEFPINKLVKAVCKKKKGKMYVALRICTKFEMNGIPFEVKETKEIKGYLPVFKTKKAAKDSFGNDVKLSEVEFVQ